MPTHNQPYCKGGARAARRANHPVRMTILLVIVGLCTACFPANLLAQLVPGETVQYVDSLGASARSGGAIAFGDFNGDGIDDIAIGASGAETVRIRLGPSGDLVKTIAEPAMKGFGKALAVCDFNDDGYDDLVVGAPNTILNSISDAGWVSIYGGSGSPGASSFLQRKASIHENFPGLGDEAESGDRFGFSLVTGDIGGFASGKCGLAIGVPGEEVDGQDGAGAVRIFSFFGAGFVPTFYKSLDASTAGIAQPGASFGSALAVGRLAGCCDDDLVVSTPFRDVGNGDPAGEVTIFVAPFTGLFQTFDEQSLYGSSSIPFSFGRSLATGDFDGDGQEDLAIGSPYGPRSAVNDTPVGLVHVIYGNGTTNLTETEVWHQDRSGIADVAEPFDFFGWSVASGNFNGDRYDDLAIGSYGEDGSDGRVDVLLGGRFGLDGDGQGFNEADVGFSISGGHFGQVLAAGDLNGNGVDDLGVGLPEWDDVAQTSVGLAYLVPSVARLVPAELVVLVGDSLEVLGAPARTVEAIHAFTRDEDGRLGINVSFTDGDTVILARTETGQWQQLADSLVSGTYGFHKSLALDSQNRYGILTAASPPSRGASQDYFAIYTQSGEIARGLDPLPGHPGQQIGFIGRIEMAAGRIYFASGNALAPLLRESAGAGLESALDPLTWLNGSALESVYRYSVSHDGASLAIYGRKAGGTKIAAINGQVVAEEDQAIGRSAPSKLEEERGFETLWISPNEVAVGGGEWIVGGSVDNGGDSAGYLVASNGSTLAAWSSRIGDTDLAYTFPTRILMNPGGQATSTWQSNSGIHRKIGVFSCGPGLTANRLVVRSDDELDLNGDGVTDASVVDLGPIGLGTAPLEGGVVALIDIKIGAATKRALVRFPASVCALFEDGFENGDTAAWQ